MWNFHHQKELSYFKLGRSPNTLKIIQPRTCCASFSSSSPNWSFDQGPEPQNSLSKNASVGRTNTPSFRHSETCGDPVPLPEPGSAHYVQPMYTPAWIRTSGCLVWPLQNVTPKCDFKQERGPTKFLQTLPLYGQHMQILKRDWKKESAHIVQKIESLSGKWSAWAAMVKLKEYFCEWIPMAQSFAFFNPNT